MCGQREVDENLRKLSNFERSLACGITPVNINLLCYFGSSFIDLECSKDEAYFPARLSLLKEFRFPPLLRLNQQPCNRIMGVSLALLAVLISMPVVLFVGMCSLTISVLQPSP